MLTPVPLNASRLQGPVWVVAPHPDDEALGCGALLAALTAQQTEVWALLLTDGGFSHPGSQAYPRERLVAARLAEWRRGLDLLGVPEERTRALGFPDGQLAEVPVATVTQAVQQAFQAAPPALVLLPWQRDPHPDHRAAWAPVRAASPAPVLGYSVWLTERGAGPDWPSAAEAQALSFDTAPYAAHKAAAIAAHATQLGTITDDPGGFTLAPEMVVRAVAGPELYFHPASQP
ncbi:PIG-L deacetylase family protein [Deinococcus sp. Marseille-Q6407]|uniref:PIG-L deacetylase family protein n=1 Tax=Deinococcus sp. Marseille-Q6407 TaxID=2969223 RepID=UPI0021BF7F0C|nr:PIG-L deacetylase family protein [Deinococcus sp. Marseille-Q6407]